MLDAYDYRSGGLTTDVATTTFGPLEKYVAANDNVPQADRGQYIGLRRDQYRHGAPFINADEKIPVLPTRHGSFMQTATGRKFWPMDPRADEVFIEDIAHSLSLQCRYAGHCLRFYSVAEHSVLMASWLMKRHGAKAGLWGLLHDASEAYLVDVPRPVKPYLTGYKAAESRVMAAVCDRFGLAHEMPPEVHEADERIIADELVNLVPMDWHARYAGRGLGVRLRYWSPEDAEAMFLSAFRDLSEWEAAA